MTRQANCGCGKAPVDSSPSLAFFEFRGEGSRAATKLCLTCNYHEVAHIEGATHKCTKNCGHCTYFVPHGAWEYDLYYCGHGGWD